MVLERTVAHLFDTVIPNVGEYELAERDLTESFIREKNLERCEGEAKAAKRKAEALAVAIDGLADRAAIELGYKAKHGKKGRGKVLTEVSPLCTFPADGAVREGCLDRVRGIANAHKHGDVDDPSLPLSSDDYVLAVGTGFGIDGFGVGKYGGPPEVVVQARNSTTWKFLGDVPAAVHGWIVYLRQHNAALPVHEVMVCGVAVGRQWVVATSGSTTCGHAK